MANRTHNRAGSLAQRIFAMDPVPEAPRTILVIVEEGIRAFIEHVTSLLWSQQINPPLSYRHAH
jgi:hypothetical protein